MVDVADQQGEACAVPQAYFEPEAAVAGAKFGLRPLL